METRAGRLVRQVDGYQAFLPKPLPPDPPIRWDGDLVRALSEADLALGRLDGIARALPNPNLFVPMYIRREAVLSSQIEGTEASLDDVLAFEVHAWDPSMPRDVTEVVNYARALDAGLNLLKTLPLSGRLLRETHRMLLTGARGAERRPGEFRTSQNWLGPAGCTLATATFVPPPPHELGDAFAALERFLNDESLPRLVHAALARPSSKRSILSWTATVASGACSSHCCSARGVLDRPLLYLSLFLRQNRSEYYDRLSAVRDHGDWEGWLRFFLQGTRMTADDAARVASSITTLRHEHLRLIAVERLGRFGVPLLDLLADQPLVSVKYATERLGSTASTIGGLLDRAVALDIIEEITGQRRNRLYRYTPYLDLFETEQEH